MRLTVLGLLLASLFLGAKQRGIDQQPEQFDPGPLELVISGPSYDYPDRLQPRTRKFTTKLINHSALPIVIGPSATEVSYSASDFFTVMDSDGKAVAQRTGYYCPVGSPKSARNVRLTDKDLMVLGPGETKDFGDFDLTELFLFPQPGEYRVRRTFSYLPPRLKETILHDGTKLAPDFDASRMSATKRRTLQNSFGFTLKSNMWILTIRPL